jgi:hypothetical protein
MYQFLEVGVLENQRNWPQSNAQIAVTDCPK